MLPQKSLERKILNNGKFSSIIGIDEVGMGSLAGPVVVCAVRFKKDFFSKKYSKLAGLKDSKLLTSNQRDKYARELANIEGLTYKICYAYPKTIDRINIHQAAKSAMRRAVNALIYDSGITIHESNIINRNSRTIVLVDGPHKIPKLNLEQMAIVKGDKKVFSIACASVLAKVYRDRMMKRYAKRYPGYGFEIHKGYGTSYHKTKLISLGPCEIHRRSFEPVGKLI